jgi:NAD(P)-dependent dehydrogenase (short-subunit alcohol dehydrogenase family)
MSISRAILVTGAATGVGAAVVRRMAAPGTAILAHTRGNAEHLATVAAEARAKGSDVAEALGDLARPETAAELVDTAIARFGRLDVMVANAGFADRTQTADLTDAIFDRSVQAMQHGFLRLARAAAPHLRGADNPRIVAVSSFVAHAYRPGFPLFPASAAAKAGLEALVKALAIELAPDITVNAVAPGFVRKDPGTHAAMSRAGMEDRAQWIPLRRIAVPDDIAAAITFLASTDAAYITGQVLHVDGGLVI